MRRRDDGRKLRIASLIIGDDGHTRITRGKDFAVQGGTQDRHDFAVDVTQEAVREAAQAGSVEDAKRAACEVIRRRCAEEMRRRS